ncbi:MAG: HAD-IIIC family phosphatase [Paludibacteraceae bacterium]|nr:HAD-IIIC family phosphatase [Paludibacteraceae bacterium]
MTYVFRNNTIERFLQGEYIFSGYDDFSAVPVADGYLWWYQVPIKYNQDQLAAEVESYSKRLLWAVEQINNKPLLILTLESLHEVHINISDRRLARAIEAFNNTAWDLAATKPNVQVLDFGEFLNQYVANERIDWKFYFLSQMILNPRLAGDFRKWFEEQQRALILKRKKCLVLDLDNTLWSGVLGEDGIEGIQVDGDYPGKAFHYWQEGIKELGRQGVILAICSKNNIADVEALFHAREMPLKLDDFACMRINWNDKASNLKAIAEDLNIGLDSFVFVDDNPTERELIKQQLPMVVVPDFPEQPYELPKFYEQLVKGYFSVYTLTDEDKKKTEQYRQNASRAQAQAQFTNMEDFLRSLEMKLTIEPASNITIPRIAQMTQKTNQFNLTTHRYSENDIRQMTADGAMIYTLAVRDRFGDNGITGLIIITRRGEIDTLLLSCRVLGKGIENAFVRRVLKIVDIKKLKARYIPTEKNGQVADFYDKLGFKRVSTDENGGKYYEADTKTLNLTIKDYYKIDL